MSKITKQDVIDSTLAIHGAGEMVSKTYAVSVIEQLEEQVTQLEQQLKTATEAITELKPIIQGGVMRLFDDCGNSYANAWTEKQLKVAAKHGFYKGKFIGLISDLKAEYANNLEGK